MNSFSSVILQWYNPNWADLNNNVDLKDIIMCLHMCLMTEVWSQQYQHRASKQLITSQIYLQNFCFSTHKILTRQIWGIWKLPPAYSPETPNLGQNRWCFVPCDLEIWWMTLENNRASLLCCFKLCATFHSHWWIQTGVTVQKRPIWIKFYDF